jgi:hypothetical protein
MARRKGEVTSSMNERDFPHIVELPLPSGGFRSQSDDMLAFHRERGIEPRRGRGWHNDEQYYLRYCLQLARSSTGHAQSRPIWPNARYPTRQNAFNGWALSCVGKSFRR